MIVHNLEVRLKRQSGVRQADEGKLLSLIQAIAKANAYACPE